MSDDSTQNAPNPPIPGGAPAWLLGRWRLLRAEPGLEFAPGVAMEFLPGGRLRYSFDVGERTQTVAMVYRVDGDVLRTDNPRAPHAAETHLRLGEAGVLEFDFSGVRAWFVRETGPPPDA